MAYNTQKLVDGIKAAFEKGRETQSVSGGEEGEVENKYTEGDVAGFIADAIVDFASDAEILLLPGPFLHPNPAPPPPVLPDVANMAALLKVQTAQAGHSILKAGFEASFAAGDPSMTPATAAIVSYAATLTFFQGSPLPNIATGVTAMAAPPIFAPVVAAGLAGADEDTCVQLMALIIDVSFRSCIFNGAGLTILAGAGPVLFQPLI